MPVEIGMRGYAVTVVTPEDTAQAVGSGLVPVFATPRMVALMEEAAVNAVQSSLLPGRTTVGTRLDVTHDAATPVGMKVTAWAEVTAIEGRKITFAVSAYDNEEQIGGGTHERAIVWTSKFLDRVQAKLEK